MRARAPHSAMLGAYRLATSLGHPLARPLLDWRRQRGKEDPGRYGERYGAASLARPDGPLVWVHAASVGETVSVLPVLARIVSGHQVTGLLTTGTVTSTRIVEARRPAGVLHQYAPLDGPRFVKRFLAHWKPGLAIFAESELWPNMILETRAHGAPLALVNARMSERSFRRWQRGPGMIRALLARFDLCLAQSDGDARRLEALGAQAVVRTGNLKFDVPAPHAPPAELSAFSTALDGRPRWAAVSIHPGEDEAVLDAHAELAERHPRLLTVIAPRHPERGDSIAELAARRGLSTARRSQENIPGRQTDIFILDTIGELGLVFRSADIIFMGKSLIAHGGQNPIEPAKLSTAILHGPNVANFAEMYAALDKAGGAQEVTGSADLARSVGRLIETPSAVALQAAAAERAVAGFGGALDKTMAALDPLIGALIDGR